MRMDTTDAIAGNTQGYTYRVHEQPLLTPRPFKVIFIGAGMSGMTFLHHIKKVPNVQVQVYEKNGDIGGTWLESRYPGCACDIPATAYAFLFESNTEWPKYYAPAESIHEYLIRVAKQEDMYKHVQLNSRVTECAWSETEGKWTVKIQNTATQETETTTDTADMLINGGGFLNSWKWPTIPGLHGFGGKLMHSANWDANYDLKGKKVALIGSGSSAVQILPNVAPLVGHITSYNRSRTWVTPGLAAHLTPDGKGNNFVISEEEKERLRTNVSYKLQKRKQMEQEIQASFKPFMLGSEEQAAWLKATRQLMAERLGHNQELIDKLVPDFPVGCRRITPGEGYLEAFLRDNVSLETTPITAITKKGIKTSDGREESYDVIICATDRFPSSSFALKLTCPPPRFDVSYCPKYPVYGRGTTLEEEIKKNGVRSYLGLTNANMPNYFTIIGAYTISAHGSMVPAIDSNVRYVIDVIKKMSTENIRSVQIKEKVMSDFMEHARTWFPRTVWMSNCSSWYKEHCAFVSSLLGRSQFVTKYVTAPIPYLYPGTAAHFLQYMRSGPRYEHYEIEYREGNCLAFLGNGFTEAELTGGDLSTYIDEYIQQAAAAAGTAITA